jgi:hypothetical protein
MLPLPLVSQLNTRLMRYFVKRYTIKRSAMALGKMLPVGIGAAVGGGGNRMMGKKIVNNARKAFGPAPARWPCSSTCCPRSRTGTSRTVRCRRRSRRCVPHGAELLREHRRSDSLLGGGRRERG